MIIDEAYIAFGGESAAPLVRKYPNLLVIQTLSKAYALAGMRIGLAFGNPELIEGLNRIKGSFNSYTMDRLRPDRAEAALKDVDYCREICRKIRHTRNEAMDRLRELGFTGTDSKPISCLSPMPRFPAERIHTQLKERGIFVRYFPAPRIANYLRITIGTPAEMERLIAGASTIVESYTA